MTPPAMAGWNLALRFGLEIGALAGLGAAAWTLTSGPGRWVAVIAVPLAAAVIWGMFNVHDDPSRSDAAPVEVDGWIRLAIELSILGGGAAAIALAGPGGLGVSFALVIAVHYAVSWSRIEWLVQAWPPPPSRTFSESGPREREWPEHIGADRSAPTTVGVGW